MAFFCAGSSSSGTSGVRKQKEKPGSKPTAVSPPHRPNGKVIVKEVLPETPMPTIPHSDAPHRRKMIVLQEYSPQDNRGLPIRRGESVLVISQEGDWLFVKNERSKEGYVPRTHLVAPYSSTRTRQGSRSGSGNPIRVVNSNSSIHDIIDHSPSPTGGRPIPMYTTQSTDRPRRYPPPVDRGGQDASTTTTTTRDNRAAHIRRVVSPPVPAQTILPIAPVDLSNNNNNVVIGITAVNGHSSYEQKHSPSSSSGVASLNGPSSPSFTSLQHSTSQENDVHRTGSNASLNHEDRSHSSLSSMDEAERQSPRKVLSPVNPVGGAGEGGRGGWMVQTVPYLYQETSTRIRATSESNLASLKRRPLPTPPRRETGASGTYVAKKTSHIYSTITDEEPPPPIPPRTTITTTAAVKHPPVISPVENGESEEYSNPADALHGQERPRFNYPRVRSLTDVRARDTRLQRHHQQQQQQQQDAQYSAVFQGGGIPPHKRAGAGANRIPMHSETESEAGSQPSHRSSSKHSGSRVRIGIEEERSTPEGPPLEKAPRLPESGYEEQQSGRDRRERRRDMLRAQTRIGKFRKCLWGLYVVIEDFEGTDENEVTVKTGEHVSVWNQDDREWYWIVKHTSNYSEEGFIPSITLREIVSSDSKHPPPVLEPVHQNGHGGGSNGGSPSLKQQLHSHLNPTESSARYRQRSGSQEIRSRRPGSGGSQGRRGRINSDSSSRSANVKVARTPSISSIEKNEIPESPPSSSPPPPYSEYDSGNTGRRFSLSQQQDSSTSNGYGTSMHRTRSHGHVHHIRGRANMQSLSQPSGEQGGLVIRRGGNRDQVGGTGSRSMMTAANSGTLV